MVRVTAKAERILMRIAKGGLVPADVGSQLQLRARNYKMGDYVTAELRKPRNPGFHRLAHAFGMLVADNIEAFEGMDAHGCLKRLQIEANAGCDEIALNFPGVGPCTYRVPRSLSFESMDEAEFKQVFKAMCEHVSKTYWRDLSADQIADMASCMPEAA